MRKDRTSTGALRASLVNLEKTGEFIAAEARKLRREVEEAHDAGLLSLRSNTGGGLPQKGTVSNTTASSAASIEFRRMQAVRKLIADRLHRSKHGAGAALAHLEAASEALFGAWLDTDPELGPQRRERRLAVANDTAVSYPPDQQLHRPPSGNGQGSALGDPTSASPS